MIGRRGRVLIQKTGCSRMDHKVAYSAVSLFLLSVVLFSFFSYYLSEVTGEDWFSRSGAVMCLVSAAAVFRLGRVQQTEIARILHDRNETDREKLEDVLGSPSRLHQLLSIAAYIIGLVGTVIWGYGDLVL